MTTKKITRTTIKNFINREKKTQNLYLKRLSDFDGRVDCVMPIDGDEFSAVKEMTEESEYNLGINGAWFVGSGRDYFEEYADENFIGYRISNCCGSFVLAMKRPVN